MKGILACAPRGYGYVSILIYTYRTSKKREIIQFSHYAQMIGKCNQMFNSCIKDLAFHFRQYKNTFNRIQTSFHTSQSKIFFPSPNNIFMHIHTVAITRYVFFNRCPQNNVVALLNYNYYIYVLIYDVKIMLSYICQWYAPIYTYKNIVK